MRHFAVHFLAVRAVADERIGFHVVVVHPSWRERDWKLVNSEPPRALVKEIFETFPGQQTEADSK